MHSQEDLEICPEASVKKYLSTSLGLELSRITEEYVPTPFVKIKKTKIISRTARSKFELHFPKHTSQNVKFKFFRKSVEKILSIWICFLLSIG